MKNLARVLKLATPGSIVSFPALTRVVGVAPPPQFHLATRFIASKVADAAAKSQIMASSYSASSSSSYSDPCLDIFFKVRPPPASAARTSHTDTALINSLEQRLPLAWSHNPLTTLKLISNLSTNHVYPEASSAATSWLHRNHPRTLAHNLDSFGGLYAIVEILYSLLLPQDQQETEVDEMEEKHRQRYNRDPHYKSLHDRAMDIFVERLKSDVQKMQQNKLELKPSDYLTDDDDHDEDDSREHDSVIRPIDADAFADLYVSEAADCFLTTFPSDAHAIRAIALRESTARRLFPLVSQSQQPDQSSKEDEQWERLRKEFLAPLQKYYKRQGRFNPRRWGVDIKYLEQVKASASTANKGNLSCVIEPDALLPHFIIRYLKDANVGEAAELQWNALLRKHKEGGKFRNCFAVCNMNRITGGARELTASLGLFVSELNEEPAWKGKLISSAPLPAAAGDDHALLFRLPHLYSVPCNDGLRSKLSFFMGMDGRLVVHLQKVFDLILQVSVNENLKPDQMIQKLFIFNYNMGSDFFDGAAWETQYEAIRTMFKDKGYGDDAVPHILFWDIWCWELPSIALPRPGVTLLRGWSNNLVRSFLENGGEIGPHHVMEAAFSDKHFQALAVVD
ncbi:hypothetical protein ACFX2G_029752 [Malus domestica]|uniref:uncharacterized protein n=1 Tax=Malus domestica TaxID=3750 RepID=UPI0039753BB9